jgi:Tol biopolymer transport system component
VLVPLALAIGAAAGILLGPSAPPPEGEVVRATIPPPDGARFFLGSRQPGPPELSPDGSRVAFIARGADREVALWVQELDAGTAVRLEGTEGASYPFWSPDGRNIGFIADRKLKRIPAEGGAVLSLCDAPFGKGGSWNEAGQILFAPMYNSPIHMVSENGGTPTVLTKLDETTRENSHRFPSFLPDGRHYLYLARLSDSPDVEGRVRIGNVDGDDLGVLLEAQAQAVYRAGHLLYIKDGVLLARPFDPATRRLSGQPFALATNVDIVAGAARGVYSATDDGKLIYMTEDRTEGQGMRWLDRHGDRLSGMADFGMLYSVAISPDGSRFAARGESDLWVFDPQRGTRQRVTYTQNDALDPVWTPDGKRLIYRARGEGFLDIYSKAADGSGDERLLVTSEGDKITNDVSPDGKALVYSESLAGGFDIWIKPLEPEGDPYPFIETPADEEEARFSPDGRFLAYQANETGVDEIFVVSFPDKRLRAQVSTEGGLSPRWNEDGTELFFHSPKDEVMAVATKLGADSIEVGTPEVLFFLTTPAYSNYDVSGDRFLVETEVEGRDRPPLHLVLSWPELSRE